MWSPQHIVRTSAHFWQLFWFSGIQWKPLMWGKIGKSSRASASLSHQADEWWAPAQSLLFFCHLTYSAIGQTHFKNSSWVWMKKGSCISAGPCGISGRKLLAHSGTFWAAANYTGLQREIFSFSFLLLHLSSPSQFLWSLLSGLEPLHCLCPLSTPLTIWRHPLSFRQWIIFHTLALVTENMMWTWEPDQSCLHEHIQWFCPLSRRFVFHCLGRSWFLPQHVL